MWRRTTWQSFPHSQPTFPHIIIPSWQLTVSMHQIGSLIYNKHDKLMVKMTIPFLLCMTLNNSTTIWFSGGGGEKEEWKVEEQVGQFCIHPNHFSPLPPIGPLRDRFSMYHSLENIIILSRTVVLTSWMLYCNVPGKQHKGVCHKDEKKKHSLAQALTLTVTPSPNHLATSRCWWLPMTAPSLTPQPM